MSLSDVMLKSIVNLYLKVMKNNEINLKMFGGLSSLGISIIILYKNIYNINDFQKIKKNETSTVNNYVNKPQKKELVDNYSRKNDDFKDVVYVISNYYK